LNIERLVIPQTPRGAKRRIFFAFAKDEGKLSRKWFPKNIPIRSRNKAFPASLPIRPGGAGARGAEGAGVDAAVGPKVLQRR
jgi:hypothetical protein